MDPEDVQELYFDEDSIPIFHQPLRRAITGGCKEPIGSGWTIKANELSSTFLLIKLVCNKISL